MFEAHENFTKSEGSVEKIEATLMTPKQMLRDLIKIAHPDQGGDHEFALKVFEAYEDAKKGNNTALAVLYTKHFSDSKNKIKIIPEESISSIEDEPDEFEKEERIRQEIYDIIFFELDELFKVAKKRKNPSIIKNHGLQSRYRDLCVQRGVAFSSDFRGMECDQKEIFDRLYNRTKSMVGEIKEMKKSKNKNEKGNNSH